MKFKRVKLERYVKKPGTEDMTQVLTASDALGLEEAANGVVMVGGGERVLLPWRNVIEATYAANDNAVPKGK